jgi:hypothetical protein
MLERIRGIRRLQGGTGQVALLELAAAVHAAHVDLAIAVQLISDP